MVKFETKLDKGLTKDANKFSFMRLRWFMLIIAAAIIFIGLIVLLFGQEEADKGFGIFLIFFGILYMPLVWLIVQLIQYILNKRNPSLKMSIQQNYSFDETQFNITEKGEGYSAEMTAQYRFLYKAYETKTHFMLYISSNQVYVIPKDSLTEGSLEDLRTYLQTNLGEKFQNKDKENS